MSTFLIDFHDIGKKFDQRRMRVCHRSFEGDHESTIYEVEEGGGLNLTLLEDAIYVCVDE